MTVLDLQPVADGRVKADPDDNHLYCCNPDVSLCGLDISESGELDFADEECCPPCLDLDDLPCGPACPGVTA
jgi:hypothetical protein